MKLPKTFLPETNQEKNLEKLLSKKMYVVEKNWKTIKTYDIHGDILAIKEFIVPVSVPKPIGNVDAHFGPIEEEIQNRNVRVTDLTEFTFNGKKFLTARYGFELDQRLVFDKNLQEFLSIAKSPNQTWTIFERKNKPDVLMINNGNNLISYYDSRGVKLEDYSFSGRLNCLSRATTSLKMKKQNYLVLNFWRDLVVVNEDLIPKQYFKVPMSSSSPLAVLKQNGDEKIIVLTEGEEGIYRCQYLTIFNDKVDTLEEEIKIEKLFGKKIPEIMNIGNLNIGDQNLIYLVTRYHKKKRKDKNILKIFDNNLEEVWSMDNYGRSNPHSYVENFNDKNYIFVPYEKRRKGEVRIYDENFNLKDKLPTNLNSSFMNKEKARFMNYKIIHMNDQDYIAVKDKSKLCLYSGDFPLNKCLWKKEPVSISLRKGDGISGGLKRVVPFENNRQEFLALEYWHNEGVDIYDNEFNKVLELPGGDFCVS